MMSLATFCCIDFCSCLLENVSLQSLTGRTCDWISPCPSYTHISTQPGSGFYLACCYRPVATPLLSNTPFKLSSACSSQRDCSEVHLILLLSLCLESLGESLIPTKARPNIFSMAERGPRSSYLYLEAHALVSVVMS